MRLPVPMSCVAVDATRRPASTETTTSQSGSTKYIQLRGGDTDAAPEAAGLAAGGGPLAPGRQRARPAVERLALLVAVPLRAQVDRVAAEAVGHLVDGLLERPGVRRAPGPRKGAPGGAFVTTSTSRASRGVRS